MEKYALYDDTKAIAFIETDDVELVIDFAAFNHCNFMLMSVGAKFAWHAAYVTGNDSVTETVIGFTEDGFLHTAHNCPIYETKWSNMSVGRGIT